MSNLYSMKPSVKPLKGPVVTSNIGTFDTIVASSLQLESINIAGLFEDGILQNVVIKDSQLINTVVGADSPNAGYFTDLFVYRNLIFLSNEFGSSATWDPDTSTFYIKNGTLKVDGCSFLGNIEICENYIKATNSDGDISIIPDGFGTIYLDGPIYNTVSQGNFYSEILNGSTSLISNNDITLFSSTGKLNLTTFDNQKFTTINGDISLNTENILPLTISLIDTTKGTLKVTTTNNSNLKSGDVVTINNNSVLNGNYTVGNILSFNSFLLTSTSGNINVTNGTLTKTNTNNILLNTNSLIKIPENTKLTFGTTTNSISANSQNLLISSNSDISLNLQTSKSLVLPKDTFIQFTGTTSSISETTGNYINYDGSSINLTGSDTITLTSTLTNINSTNTKFYDPILTIANYTPTIIDNKDRGIEYKYYDTVTNTIKLGWFGYKLNTNKFTFIPDATNNNEIISGIPGQFDIGDISANNITLNSGGNFNINCGIISNVKYITGCSGTINIMTTSNLNITSGNTISLIAGTSVYIPNNIPITLGSSGSTLIENTYGNINISSFRNITLITGTKGSVSIPIDSYLSFDGTSVGSSKITSNTSGDLIATSNKNIYLTVTTGNIIIPGSNSSTVSNIYFGSSSQSIYGNTSGININSSSLTNINSVNNINITSSVGNINANVLNGDINLYSSNGSIRLLQNSPLVFNITGTSNSIKNDSSGNLVINGNLSNNVEIRNATNVSLNASSNINLNASSNINISTGTFLNLSTDKSKYIVSDTFGNLNVINTTGNIIVSSLNTNIVNNFGSLNVLNNSLNISSSNVTISGTITNISSTNTKFFDPILTIANYTSSDIKDRGIEYYNGNNLGWFGLKNSSSRFTFYSNATNLNETMSGTLGSCEFDSMYLSNNLVFTSIGNINLNCGTITNLNTILGCNGTVNIIGSNGNVNISNNNLFLSSSKSIQIPYNIPLSFGTTSNSIINSTNGIMTINSFDNTLNTLGTLVLNSNLQINGASVNIYDPIVSIGGISGPTVNDLKDRGIEFKWNNGVSSKTGFFGYKNSLNRFVFIRDGINNNEIYSGSYSDVQFGNGYFSNLDISNGNISNVSTISGESINVVSSNINLSSGNINIPFNSNLNFGSSSNRISSDTSGNLQIKSNTASLLLNTTGSGFLQIPQNTNLKLGSNTSIINDTNSNLLISNSTGSIYINTINSGGSINIPNNTYLNFGSTQNSLISDGKQLLINGYNGISINTTTFTISGNVNITGTISSNVGSDFYINTYILPLGTSQLLNIQSVNNWTTTNYIIVSVDTNHNYVVGDSIIIKNSTSTPSIDNTYTVYSIINTKQFVINCNFSLTIAGGIGGTIKSNLTSYQGKDVGIQVNYWSTTGTSLSSGSGTAGHKTGFFGFKNDTKRWTYYNNATINNSIVTGSLSDIQINELYADKISGFTLNGTLSGGSNIISGNNFKVLGGNIDNTPIGVNNAQTGLFTQLSNTVSANFKNVNFASSLSYTFERYTLNSTAINTRNPSINYVISMFSVIGTNYTSSSGTMPSNSNNITDGTFKILVCNSMGTGCSHTVHFGNGNLIAPNPLNNSVATKITFKRQGQSAQLVFDSQSNSGNGSWILLSNGVYIG